MSDLAPPHRSGAFAPDAHAGAPAWMWWLVLAATTFVVATTLVGLPLAMASAFAAAPVGLVGLAVTAASWPLLRRLVPPPDRCTRWSDPVAAIVLGVVVVLTAWSAANMGQHVITERDPGSYLTTARWLDRDGSLRADVSVPLFDGLPVDDAGPAVYEVSPGEVEFQFSHGATVPMAIGHAIGGRRLLFASSALVGALALLATYLALSGATSRRALAAAVTAAFGATLPFLYVTRATYSEPFVLLLLAAATALLLACGRRPDAWRLGAVGALVGSTVMFRVDAELYVVALVAAAVLLVARGTPWRPVITMLAAAAVPWVVGTVDVRAFSGDYTDDLTSNLRVLDVALVAGTAALGLAGLVRRRRPLTVERVLDGAPPALGVAASWAVAVGGVALWLVRPRVSHAVASWDPAGRYGDAVAALQADLGLEVDRTRSYAELGLASIGWYLGAVTVALAIAGAALLAGHVLVDPRSRWTPVVLVLAVGAPLYLWDSNISPDQLWASRRFVPLVIPAVLLCATVAAEHLVALVASAASGASRGGERRARQAATATVGAVAVLVLAPTIATTWPLRSMTDQRGWSGALDAACDVVGPDAAVLELGGTSLSMPMRAWCGTDQAGTGVAPADPAAVAATVAEVARRAAATCTPTFVAARDAAVLDGYADVLGTPTVIGARTDHAPERTLVDAPDDYVLQQVTIALAPVLLPPTCPVR